MVKVSKICIGLKKTCLGVLKGEERDKDNATGLKEGGVIEISTTVLFHIRDARSLSLFHLITSTLCLATRPRHNFCTKMVLFNFSSALSFIPSTDQA